MPRVDREHFAVKCGDLEQAVPSDSLLKRLFYILTLKVDDQFNAFAQSHSYGHD